MFAQQPGAVQAHGHSGFVVLFFLALLQLCSATPEIKAWPSKFRCITTAVLEAFPALCAQVSTALPPTLCPLAFCSAPFQPSLGFGIGDGVGGLGEIGRGRQRVSLCFVLGPP